MRYLVRYSQHFKLSEQLEQLLRVSSKNTTGTVLSNSNTKTHTNEHKYNYVRISVFIEILKCPRHIHRSLNINTHKQMHRLEVTAFISLKKTKISYVTMNATQHSTSRCVITSMQTQQAFYKIQHHY